MSIDTSIEVVGRATIDTPLETAYFVEDSHKVLHLLSPSEVSASMSDGEAPLAFQMAGPRRKIFFDPSKLKCAIVTCGGLCPGLNNVIRSVVLTLYHSYGVRTVFGVRYGLQGFIPKYGHPVLELTPDAVTNIHELGGTILSSSRGPQDIGEIVDALERMNIGMVFLIGGDGTFRAAAKIAEEIKDRGDKIAIVCVPKTIDNDIHLLSRSFGFNTAVGVATKAIASAHVESTGTPNGVGLVKLMGRHSGFIAAWAGLAQRDANLVLIPEADFEIEGRHGLLSWLEDRLKARGHAVVVVAEGAGQKYCGVEGEDESGNKRLGDIGQWLKDRITTHFKEHETEISVKYIDPSYMIRSVPANPDDAVFCGFLGQKAVHAGMAGMTSVAVGTIHDEFVLIPVRLATQGRKQVDLKGQLWRSVLEATGQPSLLPDS